MLMQPPAHSPGAGRGFPRRTFKGVAGTTIALGLLCIVLCVAEIIYSAHRGPKCIEMDWEWNMEQDDEVFLDRRKRSHGDGMRDWVRDGRGDSRRPGMPPPRRDWDDDDDSHEKHRSSSDSDSSESDSAHSLEWLQDAMESHDPAARCAVFAAAAACAAMVNACCGVVFVVTGSLGVAAARTSVGHRQSGLKTGYMVMNILVVLGFAPVVFILGSFIARAAPVVVEESAFYKGHVVTAQMMALIGAALGVLCLVAASISCCCAPTHDQVKVVTMAAPLAVKEKHPLEGGVIAPGQITLCVDEKAELVRNEGSEA